jgi:signal transduction histidine kinase
VGTSLPDPSRASNLTLPVEALDQMIEGCQIIGYDFTYLYINDRAARHGQTTREARVGRTMMACYPGVEQTTLFARIRRAMTERSHERFEYEHDFGDGTRTVLALRVVPVPEGVCIFSLDVSDRRQLAHARDLAVSANRELEAFASTVAHDLRAPLRHINGFSGALLEDCALDELARGYVARIRNSSARMAQLIEDLLQLAHATSQDVGRKPVDLSALAATSVARLRAAEPGRQVGVTIEPGMAATGDPQLIGILLDNLIVNAWKFTGQHAAPRIEITRAPGGFVVRDNGVGFAMADAKNLFLPFHRLATAAPFEGTGIGLATVQRIVQRHGGRVWALSEVGAGAAFFFTLEPG